MAVTEGHPAAAARRPGPRRPAAAPVAAVPQPHRQDRLDPDGRHRPRDLRGLHRAGRCSTPSPSPGCCRGSSSWASTSTTGSGPRRAGSAPSRTSASSASLSMIFTLVHRLPPGRAARPQGAGRGRVPHHLPLPLRAVVHRHRPRLAVDPEPPVRGRAHRPRLRLGELPLRPALRPGPRALRAADRRPLAGHGPHHVHHAGGPAGHRRGHLEGRAGGRHPDLEDLHPRHHPDDAPGLRHRAGADRVGDHQGLRPRHRPDVRRARPRLGHAGHLRDAEPVRRAEPRAGLRRLDHDAASAWSSS